jgi:hypothetical protein
MQQHHACRGGALKHVKPWHEGAAVFHEDGACPSVEAGLRVIDTCKPGDELGAVLVVIEPIPGPMLDPMQQHPPQWYALSHYGFATHPTHLRTSCPQAAKIFHGVYCSHSDVASNLNSHICQELLHGTRTHAAAAKDRSLGRRATSRQSEALGMRGIRVEQGEFQKILLGFYDHFVLEGFVVRGCRTSRGSQSSSFELCESRKPCMKMRQKFRMKESYLTILL